jgi:hypothetical protein
MDVVSGITAGVLRLGIAQGGYTAYVEVADSGVGFRYWVTCDGVCLWEGEAPDFPMRSRVVEAELRLLCSAPVQ